MPKTITLRKNEDRRITNGHLWAFSNEIASIDGEPGAGDIVELNNHAGHLLGVGFYNPHSLIAVRLLSREREEIDFQFFRKRIEDAHNLRRHMYDGADAFRLVHGESDFLPGLVIDKYADCLCLQTFSFGMDKRTTLICDVLDSLFKPKGIVERNETPIRSLEILPQQKGIIRGAVTPVTITENGISYRADLLEGQKTGLFLDQRENRFALRRYANVERVLDICCNDGGFALNAAFAGAGEAIGIDVSEEAVQRATANAALNNLQERARFVTSDMFTFLGEELNKNSRFDLVNLDPPSFAKNKKSVTRAKRGYSDLHTAALKVLKPGGILATSSCSHHIEEETFLDIISASARNLGRSVRLLEWHGASPDHPVLPQMPETYYLKFGIFHVQ